MSTDCTEALLQLSRGKFNTVILKLIPVLKALGYFYKTLCFLEQSAAVLVSLSVFSFKYEEKFAKETHMLASKLAVQSCRVEAPNCRTRGDFFEKTLSHKKIQTHRSRRSCGKAELASSEEFVSKLMGPVGREGISN